MSVLSAGSLSDLMIGGLAMLKRRPSVSGVLFGLLTFKPQLGLMLPVMLAVTRQWRCIASASATILVLVVATGALFGFSVWSAWFTLALPAQNYILQESRDVFVAYMPTPFMSMRALGMALPLAWAVQAIISAGALGGVIWTFRKSRDAELSNALLLTASLLATPYAFPYDTVVLVWVVARLRERADQALADDVLALLVWALPVAAFGLGSLGIPVAAWILVAYFLRLLARLKAQDSAPLPLAV
jgi:hypothetical protein